MGSRPPPPHDMLPSPSLSLDLTTGGQARSQAARGVDRPQPLPLGRELLGGGVGPRPGARARGCPGRDLMCVGEPPWQAALLATRLDIGPFRGRGMESCLITFVFPQPLLPGLCNAPSPPAAFTWARGDGSQVPPLRSSARPPASGRSMGSLSPGGLRGGCRHLPRQSAAAAPYRLGRAGPGLGRQVRVCGLGGQAHPEVGVKCRRASLGVLRRF